MFAHGEAAVLANEGMLDEPGINGALLARVRVLRRRRYGAESKPAEGKRDHGAGAPHPYNHFRLRKYHTMPIAVTTMMPIDS